MKRFFTTYLTIIAALALAAFSGAACSTTEEANANRNANTATTTSTTTTTATTATPSPVAATASPMAGMADHNSNMAGMDHGAMQSSPNAASAPYDLQFLDTMMHHHQGAVDMARPAETKAQHPELKALARSIMADQEREIAQMKSWREQWFAGKAAAMNMEMTGMADSMKGMDMNALNAATGNAYDLMFLDMMVPHHLGAVIMGREALTRAQHPEIKRLAQQIIDSQQREIAQMNKWKQAWALGAAK